MADKATEEEGNTEDKDAAPDALQDSEDSTPVSSPEKAEEGSGGEEVEGEEGESFMSSAAGRSENDRHVTPHTLSPRSYSAAVRNEPATYSVAFTEVEELALTPEAPRSGGSAAGEAVEFYTGNPSVVQYKGQVPAPLVRQLSMHLRLLAACWFPGSRGCGLG